MTRSLLDHAFGHHIWATISLIDACAALDPAQLGEGAEGTYGSIIATMRHIVGADSSYLGLLSDGRVALVDDEDESIDLPALRAAMERHGPVWSWVLEQDPDPDQIVVRHRDDGSTASVPMGIRLAQVVQHGTDHRSQICTSLTTLGVTPPEIDAWDYAVAVGLFEETPPTS